MFLAALGWILTALASSPAGPSRGITCYVETDQLVNSLPVRTPEEAGAEVRVDLVALSIVRQLPERWVRWGGGVKTARWLRPGIDAVLQFTIESGLILQAYTLVDFSMTDDLGANLNFAPNDFASFQPLAHPDDPTAEGLFEVHAPKVPSSAAKRITLKGQALLVLTPAKKWNTFSEDNVRLAIGTEIRAGLRQLKITEVNEDPSRIRVTLETQEDFAPIRAFRFFDDAGKRIDAIARTYSYRLEGERAFHRRTVELEGRPTIARVEVDYWADISKVLVPYEVRVPVGPAVVR